MESMRSKIFQLYILLLAIPLVKIIESVSSEPNYNSVSRFIILLLFIVEWIYSQASFRREYPYLSNSHRFLNIFVLSLETAICVFIAFAAYQMNYEINYYIFILWFLFFDLILQALSLAGRQDHMLRVTKSWIRLNLLEAGFFFAGLIALKFDVLDEYSRSTILVIVIASLTFWNLYRNHAFYFSEK
jgi:hypothetical protein